MTQNSSCKLCPLHSNARSVCIPGRGSEKPKYLFVGQAPGEQEDLQNEPFIGPAGRMLTQAIQKFDLRPARLSNAVRCWPPQDREPKKDEIEACKPYLMEEIKKHKPEWIVAVGGVALNALTGKKGISDYAGRQVGNLNGSKIFALYHPSFVLHQPKQMEKFESGFKALKAASNGVSSPKIDFEVITPGAAEEIYVHHKGFLAFDFETNGRYKKDGGRITCMSLSSGENTWVVPADEFGFDSLLERMTTFSTRLCAHNSVFERRWFLDLFGKAPLNLCYDTMLLDYIFFEERMHDLESVAGYWLENAPSWKLTAEMKENGWTWETVPQEILYPYSAMDSFYTHKIMEKMLGKIKALAPEEKSILSYYAEVLLPTAEMCAWYEHRGIAVDSDWIERVQGEYRTKMGELETKMKKDSDKDFNPGSSSQVAAVLTKLGIKTDFTTEKGAMSVASQAIEPIRNKHPFISAYADWKELKTLDNNYLEKFYEMSKSDGRVYPSFNPAFQVTGRISVSKPPAANIPRDPQVRGMVFSRFEGGKILALDYAQLEMRLVASEANDEAMLQIFKEGLDIHDETTKELFGGDFTKEDRDLGKAINFSTIYGISGYSLSLKFGVPERRADDLLSRHRKKFPDIYRWMDAQHREIADTGQIKSRLGQVRHFPGWKTASDKDRFRMMRQAGNFPIQSLGAHLTNLSAFEINKFLMEHFKSVIFMTVHDSAIIDLHPADKSEEVKDYCAKIMSVKVPKRFAPFLRVALPVGVSVTQRWGEPKDGE